MKTILIVILLFLSILNPASSQKYGNVWQFGYNAGIDFNSCEPIALTTGKNAGFEGCASICDSNGQLLFYTNSETVWDRQHRKMPNGFLIQAGVTLSQVIIIPKPGMGTTYYIITTDIQAQGKIKLQYHEVDMTLNSGNGDVVSKNNVLTEKLVTEQIAATYHRNQKDIWLVTHEYGSNNFLEFLVTKDGISTTPIVISVGPAVLPCNSYVNARGAIKFSPNGRKLAYNANGTGEDFLSNALAVFNFDNENGRIYNPIELPYSGGEFGLTFSPDNTKLYGTTWKALNFGGDQYNYLYQFDITFWDSLQIVKSKVLLDSIQVGPFFSFGDIKLGPDGKVYVAISGDKYLGVIGKPNLKGEGCAYRKAGLFLGGKICASGLNNYIEYNNYCQYQESDPMAECMNKLTIYPNPFPTQTSISFINPQRFHYSLKVFDVLGQLCKSINNITTDIFEFERQDLARGVYFVRLYHGRNFITESKMVVE